MADRKTGTPVRDRDVPTWGYHPLIGAKLFENAEALDAAGDEWADHPFPGQRPHDARRGRTTSGEE